MGTLPVFADTVSLQLPTYYAGTFTVTPVATSPVASFTPLFNQGSAVLPGIGGGGSLANTTYVCCSRFSTAPLGMTIGHLNVSCAAYNAADAATGLGAYKALSAAGLGGATIHFGVANAANSALTPLNLGQVVIPTSPQAGPWVTAATGTVATPYTVAPGDMMVVTVSNTDTTTTQWASACVPYVGA